MEGTKKRKLDETGATDSGDGYSDEGDASSLLAQSERQLRFLLDPLRKDQLVDLLVKLVNQYPSVAEEIRDLASSDPVHRRLFVRGLAWETTSETLCAAFRVHGEIEEGAVIVDKATGKSRGYGFITYKHMESAQKALEEPSRMIDGRLAVCNLACESLSSISISTDVALRKIYIGGLSPDISSETLLNFFRRHGEIEEGSVAYESETNKSRGFGFVTYKTAEAAKKAIADPNKALGGRNITVKLAGSPKRKVIQAQLPAAMVPMNLTVPMGYTQPIKTQIGSPIGYSPYSSAGTAYPTSYQYPPAQYPYSPYSSAGTEYPTSYQYPPAQYPPNSQMLYSQASGKQEPAGLPLSSPWGIGDYPYYTPKRRDRYSLTPTKSNKSCIS